MRGLVWLADAAIFCWWARLAFEVLFRPARRWPTRWLGKAVAVVAVAAGWHIWAGVVLPYGAVWVAWRVRVRARDPFELPMADGRPLR